MGREDESLICQRQEVRYLLGDDYDPEIQILLNNNGFSVEPHKNPITQTVYFASPALKTVSGGYIRTRRYISKDQSAQDIFDLFPEGEWFLEVKLSTGEKERIQRTHGEIEKLLKFGNRRVLAEQFLSAAQFLYSFNDRLIPIVATQWFREHFLSSQYQSRVTIDRNMTYYGFIPDQQRQGGALMGSRRGLKVEIKTPLGFDQELSVLRERLLGTLPIEFLPENWHEDMLRKLYSKFLLKSHD